MITIKSLDLTEANLVIQAGISRCRACCLTNFVALLCANYLAHDHISLALFHDVHRHGLVLNRHPDWRQFTVMTSSRRVKE